MLTLLACTPETLLLQDAGNYTYDGSLEIPGHELVPLSDNTLDWSGVDSDLSCHELDPVTDIDNVQLLVFPELDEAAVAAGFAEDSLKQVDLGSYASLDPQGGVTSAAISELTFFGTIVNLQDEFDEGSGTWVALLGRGTEVGVGTYSMAFLRPDSSSSETRVALVGGCGVLEYEVDVSATTELSGRVEVVDWSELSTTGQGRPFDPLDVSEVMLARFEDGTDLEADFLDLELIADELVVQDHGGGTSTELDLSVVDSGETWLLALGCDSCTSPAPLYMTRLVR
ncbi:MAG TPA: hypothetical protein QGF58_16115 [Myxococcota bacterium]|nr:hypothetical protein [Myxococcota bacterium]